MKRLCLWLILPLTIVGLGVATAGTWTKRGDGKVNRPTARQAAAEKVLAGDAPARKTEAPKAVTYEPVEGDLIFQSLPRTPLVEAIEGSSGSPFSHCGIVRRSATAADSAGKSSKTGGNSSTGRSWLVLEAIGPVKETPLAEWVSQGRGQGFAVFRLKQPWQGKIPAFLKAAETYKGRPYDIHYDMDDERIYCSELLWKAFRLASGEELGQPQPLKELNWKPYVEIIRRIENGNVPLERHMITPRAVSEAVQVEKVFAGRGWR